MLLLLLAACGSDEVMFTISPNPVAFGDVDFAVEMPADGYSPIATGLTNAGTKDVVLGLADFDDTYLGVQGYSHDLLPGTMGTVAPNSTYVLNIAVCGYAPGERGSEVSTNVTISTDGSPASFTIPVTFTPYRGGDDSG